MIRRILIICVIASAGFAAGYFTNRPAAAPIAPRLTLEELSSRRLSNVEIHTTTFGGVMDEIQAITRSNMVVDWPGLAEHGVSPDTKLTADISFHDVTVEQLLNRISKATDCRNTHLVWTWQDGILNSIAVSYGSTDFGNDCGDVDSRSVVTCIYDISGLLQNQKPWRNLALSSKTPAMSNEEPADLLMSTLIALVDPDSWRDNGGMSGSMRPTLGKLFVTQTVPNQRAIYSIIQILRGIR